MTACTTHCIDDEISKLRLMSRRELKEAFQVAFRCSPPEGVGSDFLAGNIAYHLQAKAYGDLNQKLQSQLRGIAEKALSKGKPSDLGHPTTLSPGTKLIRTWQREVHEVVVTPTGFVYRGKDYDSLSSIARHITGTAWNGWLFFGLKKAKTHAA